MMRIFYFISLTIVTLFLVSCSIPKDSRDSLERAKSTTIKVGAIENPPFVIYGESELTGSEIEMIRDFALNESLEIDFIKGSESDLMKKIEEAEIHIVVGGITKKTVWKEKSGQTKPYDGDHVWLVPKGENRLVFTLETFFHAIEIR